MTTTTAKRSRAWLLQWNFKCEVTKRRRERRTLKRKYIYTQHAQAKIADRMYYVLHVLRLSEHRHSTLSTRGVFMMLDWSMYAVFCFFFFIVFVSFSFSSNRFSLSFCACARVLFRAAAIRFLDDFSHNIFYSFFFFFFVSSTLSRLQFVSFLICHRHSHIRRMCIFGWKNRRQSRRIYFFSNFVFVSFHQSFSNQQRCAGAGAVRCALQTHNSVFVQFKNKFNYTAAHTP